MYDSVLSLFINNSSFILSHHVFSVQITNRRQAFTGTKNNQIRCLIYASSCSDEFPLPIAVEYIYIYFIIEL